MDSTRYDVADVVVIGAGPAGLQAAQTLGRMRRSVVVVGSGRYRNDPAGVMHNFLGHDGTPPAQLREAARADAERYETVSFLDREVLEVAGELGHFTVRLAGTTEDDRASDTVRGRRLLLATGMADDLPDVPGVAQLFGDLVAHCPFCHGHEFADRPVGILGSEPQAAHLALMLAPIASELVLLTDGGELDEASQAVAARVGATVRGARVLGVSRGGLGVLAELDDGSRVDLAGMFVRTRPRQAAPFAAQLGLELNELGAVPVDAFGRSTRPGVYAAGDMAHGAGMPPMPSVLNAAAAGMASAAGCVQDMIAESQATDVHAEDQPQEQEAVAS